MKMDYLFQFFNCQFFLICKMMLDFYHSFFLTFYSLHIYLNLILNVSFPLDLTLLGRTYFRHNNQLRASINNKFKKFSIFCKRCA